jgi:TFIIH basal transcription factor complex TTD-A subunit
LSHKKYLNNALSLFSDAVLKQFLLHLDETLAFGRKFVLEDLDETHLFISSDIVNTLKEKVWELMDNNSFNVTKLD